MLKKAFVQRFFRRHSQAGQRKIATASTAGCAAATKRLRSSPPSRPFAPPTISSRSSNDYKPLCGREKQEPATGATATPFLVNATSSFLCNRKKLHGKERRKPSSPICRTSLFCTSPPFRSCLHVSANKQTACAPALRQSAAKLQRPRRCAAADGTSTC